MTTSESGKGPLARSLDAPLHLPCALRSHVLNDKTKSKTIAISVCRYTSTNASERKRETKATCAY